MIRRLLLGLAALLGLILAAAGGAIAWLTTSAGNEFLRGKILDVAKPDAGSFDVARLETNLVDHLRVTGLSIVGPDGRERVGADVVEVRYALGGLPGKMLRIRSLAVNGLRVDLDDGGAFDGIWVSDAPEAPSKPWSGIGIDVVVDDVWIDGRARFGEWSVDGIGLRTAVALRGPAVEWTELRLGGALRGWPVGVTTTGEWRPDQLTLGATTAGLGPSTVSAEGSLAGRDVRVAIENAHVDTVGLLAFAPIEGQVRGSFDATGEITGTLDDVAAAIALTTPGGAVEVSGHYAPATETWGVRATPHDLDLAAFTTAPVTVDGTAAVDGVGTKWPEGIRAHATADVVVGVEGESIDAHVVASLAEGIVTAKELRAGVRGGGVEAIASANLVEQTATATVTSSWVDLSRAGIVGRAQFAGLARGGWSSPLYGSAEGRIVATGVTAGGVTVAAVSGPVRGSWDGKAGGGTATLSATGISGSGLTVQSVEVIGGADWDGKLSASAEANLVGLRYDRFAAATGHLVASVKEDVASATLTLDEPDRNVLDLAGSFALSDRSIRVERLAAAPLPGIQWTAEGVQTARIADDGVEDVRVKLRTQSATVSATGSLHRRGLTSLVVEVAGLDLAEFAVLAPEQLAGWSGTLDLQAGVQGAADRLLVEGRVGAANLTIPDAVDAIDLELATSVTDGRAQVTGSVRRDTLLATIDGAIPAVLSFERVTFLQDGPLDFRLTVPPSSSEEWSAALARELPAFRLSAEARLGGTPRAPTAAVIASAELPAGQESPTWLRADLDTSIAEDLLTVRAIAEHRFAPRAAVDGTARVALTRLFAFLSGRAEKPDPATLVSELDIAVSPRQLPLAAIRPLVGLPEGIEGDLSGGVLLSGTPSAPVLQGGVNLANARIGDLPFIVKTARLDPDEAGYRVTLETVLGEGTLDATGHVPVREDDVLNVKIMGANLPLAALVGVAPGVTAAEGRLTLGGTVTGPLADPQPAVRFAVNDAALTLEQTGVAYRDVELLAEIDGSSVEVERFSLRTPPPTPGEPGGGLKGQLSMGWRGEREIGGKVELDSVWLLAQTDRRIAVSGQLSVSGKADALKAKGELNLDAGRLRLPERMFSGSRAMEIDPAITIVRAGRIERREVGVTALVPPWLTADIAVDLRRNLFLDVDMALQNQLGLLARDASKVAVKANLDGTLEVRASGGALSLAGAVEPLRGSIDVLGNSFDISEGSVTFTGRDWRSPVLDLHATHNSRYGGVEVIVGGTPEDPSIAFEAENPQYGPDDALAIIAIGRPLSEQTAGENEDLGMILLEVAASQLRSQVSDIASYSRLELLEITETSQRGGFSVGKDFFLTIELNATADTSQGENQSSITLEYRTPTKWFLELSTGDTSQSFGAKTRWRF